MTAEQAKSTSGLTRKKTLVLGASPHPWRYSHFAVKRLVTQGHAVIPLGNRPAKIAGLEIATEKFPYQDVDTVTIYLRPELQREYEEYILALRPRRIIFNPGAENSGFEKKARQAGIDVQHACTLVMLSTGQY